MGKEVEVLLITSRETKRWIVPKGNLEGKRAPHAVAAQEAEEEAGVRGRIGKNPIGQFTYLKRLASGRTVTTKVLLFPLLVDEVLDDYKERAERSRCWFVSQEAAALVAEPDLAELLAGFHPAGK